MTNFTEDQLAALATLTTAYPRGITLSEDRLDDIRILDGLVASGHAVRVEGNDFEGIGFQFSPEMAEANRQVLQRYADEARLN